VIGVPVVATPLNGLDALLSIMQMPAGVGVATVSVGAKGAQDAASFAVAALAARDPLLRAKLRAARGGQPGGVDTPKEPGKVAILADNESDFQVLRHAEEYLSKLNVAHEKIVMGLPLAPGAMVRQLADLEARRTAVFIAGSRDGIGFASKVAKTTALPVLGVPIVGGPVGCVDDFLRPFLDMPPGLAAFAIGKPGAVNAALFAATIISERQSDVWKKLHQMREDQVKRVRGMTV
jgi:5-(carboxyamino)imidazole ribonucleotide mutase